MPTLSWNESPWLEACLRALVSAAVLSWIWASCSRALRRARGAAPWDLEVLGVVPLSILCLLVPAILLGIAGWLRDTTWAAAALLCGTWVRYRLFRGATPPVAAAGDDGPRPGRVFSIALSGFLFGRALFVLRNPPGDVDSIFYHLGMVAHWMTTGGLGVTVREPFSSSEAFPGCGELLQAWFAWSCGNETLMPWVGLILAGLLALGLRRLGLRFGAHPAVAGVVALGFTAAPGMVQLGTGTRIDVTMAGLMAAGLLWGLRFRERRDAADATLLLACLGPIAGTKGTGPAYALLLLAVATAGPGAGERLRALLRFPGALAAAAWVGGFWYARNLLLWANPLFPAELQLGPLTLPGAMPRSLMWGTSQWRVWQQGFAGHFTLANLGSFYGVGLAAVLLAPVAAVYGRIRGPRAAGSPGGHEIAAIACLGVLALAATWFTPFSGANLPSAGGAPPPLAVDNVRYYLPAMLMLAAVAAGLVSRLPRPDWIAAALAVAVALLLRRHYGHLVPGVTAVLLVAGVIRAAPRFGIPVHLRLDPVRVTVLALGIALMVARVDANREVLTDRLWDGHLREFPNLDAATIRTLREGARGRPIALVGVGAWWRYYGRDFSGRPLYVPTALDRGRAVARFTGARDPRPRADRGRWLANLEASGAAYIVAACFRAGTPPAEAQWCRADTARFRLVAARDCIEVYEVRGAPVPGSAASLE